MERAKYRETSRSGGRLAPSAVAYGVAVSVLMLLLATSTAAADPPRLLLLPIVVHSAEDPDYLRAGLSDMLAARFERIGAVELIRGKVEGKGTTDPAKALELARERGADYVLYGSFTRFGQGASLDVLCAPVLADEDDTAREPLREIFVHSGSIGEIIPDLDDLAGKVSRFARGEFVATGVPAALGTGPSTQAVGRLQDFFDRVEALEAVVSEMLAGDAESGADADLR